MFVTTDQLAKHGMAERKNSLFGKESGDMTGGGSGVRDSIKKLEPDKESRDAADKSPQMKMVGGEVVMKMRILMKLGAFKGSTPKAEESALSPASDAKAAVPVIPVGTVSHRRMSTIAAMRVIEKKEFGVEGVADLGSLGPGGYFGERSLLTDEPIAATITAVTDVTLYKLDKYSFMRYLSGLKSISDRCINDYGVLILKALPVFKGLSSQNRKEVISLLKTRIYKAGEVIVAQGDEARTFFIVSEGQVEVQQTMSVPEGGVLDAEGGKIVSSVDGVDSAGARVKNYVINFGVIAQGGYFGEQALLRETKRMANVVALEDTTCYTLGHDDFHRMINLREDKYLPLPTVAMKSHKKLTNQSFSLTMVEMPSKKKLFSAEVEDSMLSDFIVAPKPLGKGAFGEVKLAIYKPTGKSYAIKTIYKETMEATGDPELHVELIQHEVRVMSEMEPSPFLLRMHATFKDNAALYIVSDVIEGQELYARLQEGNDMTADAQKFYAANVLLMIEELHRQQFVYRDIKPENLMIGSDGYMCLVDFGFAKRMTSDRTWTFCGSPDYLAPEIVSCVGHDFMVDWWTLGILIFEIVTGETPFHDSNPYHIYSNILMGKVTKTVGYGTSEHCLSLVDKLLQRNRVKRLGYLGAASVKQHPWFRGLDFALLKSKKLKAPWVPGKQLYNRMIEKHPVDTWLPLGDSSDMTVVKGGDWFSKVEWKDF